MTVPVMTLALGAAILAGGVAMDWGRSAGEESGAQTHLQAGEEPADPKLPYVQLGQEPAGMTPAVFAPGVLSRRDRYEYGIAISADGREIFFGVAHGGRADIQVRRYAGGEWSEDLAVIPDAEFSFNDPFLSKDEERLYFISDLALSGEGRKRDHDIWYVERRGEGWSDPIHGGDDLNTPFDEYFVSLTDKGTLFFGSNRPKDSGSDRPGDFDLYASPGKDGTFGPARRLPGEVNTKHYEADVFVAPDESYVVFCAERPGGKGRGDLYISFRRPDGDWAAAKSLDKVNTEGHELCPFVTRDGKYFFYTSREQLYWVDAKLLESYR